MWALAVLQQGFGGCGAGPSWLCDGIGMDAEMRQTLKQLQRREAALMQQRSNGTSNEPAATAELLSIWWVHPQNLVR